MAKKQTTVGSLLGMGGLVLIFIISVVLIFTSLRSRAAEHPTPRSTAESPPLPPPTPPLLASRVAQTYTDANSLEQHLVVTEWGRDPAGNEMPQRTPAIADVRCADGNKVRIDRFDASNTFIWSRVSDGTTIEERAPGHESVREKYTPETKGSALLDIADGCSIGTCLSSWVDDRCHWLDVLQRRLAEGRIVGSETVDGHDCWVVEYAHEFGTHAYAIDKSRWLLLRWTTDDIHERNPDGSKRVYITRQRDYSHVSINSVDPAAFALNRPEGIPPVTLTARAASAGR